MRFVYIAGFILVVILFGTVGYALLEGWSLSEAFYMTMISLTTVGFGEVHPMGTSGRMFTVVLLLLGIGSVFYATASVAEAMIEGRIRQILGRRKQVRELQNLKDHNIVCGYGRIGFTVTRELMRESQPFVIIERDIEKAAGLNEAGHLVIQGDATSDEVLLEAGVRRAKSLICTLATDAENVFVTLSAHELNPNLFILARAARESSIHKMEMAGANRVISPYTMGGLRMAQSILRPKLAGFLDEIAGYTTSDFDFDEIIVPEKSGLVGRALRESRISQETGVYLLAVRRRGGRMNFNPGPDFTIEAEDHLYALGQPVQVESLRRGVMDF
ncbi:potassium channel family protein [Nitrospinota bacterium]